MIAVIREVAAGYPQVFPWSECQVMKLAASHCTNLISSPESASFMSPPAQETPGHVYSHQLVAFYAE